MRMFNLDSLIETLTGKTEKLLRSAYAAKTAGILFARLAGAAMETPVC